MDQVHNFCFGKFIHRFPQLFLSPLHPLVCDLLKEGEFFLRRPLTL